MANAEEEEENAPSFCSFRAMNFPSLSGRWRDEKRGSRKEEKTDNKESNARMCVCVVSWLYLHAFHIKSIYSLDFQPDRFNCTP